MGASGEAKMSQNYQNVPKFCDLSVKITPDLKKKLVFVAKRFKNWVSLASKFQFFRKIVALGGDSTQFCKTMRSLGEIVKNMLFLGEGDAKNEGLNGLTAVSPPERECPPQGGQLYQ